MIEDEIKNFEGRETITANFGNLFLWIMQIFIVFSGVNIVSKITDQSVQLFGLIVVLFIFFKYMSFPFAVVYQSKDGGIIRYN